MWCAYDGENQILLARPPGELTALSSRMLLMAALVLGAFGFQLLSALSRHQAITRASR